MSVNPTFAKMQENFRLVYKLLNIKVDKNIIIRNVIVSDCVGIKKQKNLKRWNL